MTDRCDYCGRRRDRPGFACDMQHPQPDFYQRSVAAIEADLNDRRGLHLNGVDDELQDEIRDRWAELILEVFIDFAPDTS